MRVVFRKATLAVLGAATDYTNGVASNPTALEAYPAFNGATDDSFILSDSSAPDNLTSSRSSYLVDSAITPTTVVYKNRILISTSGSSIVADGQDSVTVNLTVVDNTGSTVVSPNYVIKVKSNLGFVVNNTVTTSSGLASTTLISVHTTGDCTVTAVPNDGESLLPASTTISITSSGSVTSPGVFNGILNVGKYIKMTDVADPGNPGDGFGNLYKKTGTADLFWKPNSSGAEVNITSGAGGSGNVTGPVSSTNTALVRWSGVLGTNVVNSTVLLDGSGNFTGVGNITGAGAVVISSTGGGNNIILLSSNDINLAGNNFTITTTASNGILFTDVFNSSSLKVGGTNPSKISISTGTGNFFTDLSSTSGNAAEFKFNNTSGDFIISRVSGQKFLFTTDTTNDYLVIKSGYVEIDNVPSVPTSAVGKGALYKKSGSGGLFWKAEGGSEVNLTTVGGGNTTGAASSTDNALVRFDGTTGKIIQNGTILQSDSGDLSHVLSITGQSSSGFVMSNANNIEINAFGGSSGLAVIGDTVDIQDTTGVNNISITSSSIQITSGNSNPITIGAGPGQNINTTGSIIPAVDLTDNIGSTSRTFASVHTPSVISSPYGLGLTGTGSTALTAIAGNININADTTISISAGLGSAGAIGITGPGGATVESTIPLTPDADGSTSLGTSTKNWQSVFSRLYDTKAGQDITFRRAGVTNFVIGASNITFSNNIVMSSSFITSSTTTGITAAGTNQATATSLTTQYNQVSTTASSTGVKLPTALTGMEVVVINYGANTLNVFPNTGAQINALGTNNANTLATVTSRRYVAISSTQWYSIP